MNIIERYIKFLGKKIGIEVKRYNMYSSPSLQLHRLLVSNKIETVIDIGANIGQYAMDVRGNGYKGKIISFEPLSDAYKQLKKNTLKDPEWFVADRMALGNEDGEVEINVSANSQSSSLLPIMEAHIKLESESIYIKKESVPIRRLDSISAGLDLKGNIFIKMDVQGYEYAVLKGAENLLAKTKGLQLELSLIELYKGQKLMLEMIRHMENLGFKLYALFPCVIDESSSRLLQVDGVFFAKFSDENSG